MSDSDPSAETANMALPVKSDRIGTVLAFDEVGNPTPGPSTANVGSLLEISSDVLVLPSQMLALTQAA